MLIYQIHNTLDIFGFGIWDVKMKFSLLGDFSDQQNINETHN